MDIISKFAERLKELIYENGLTVNTLSKSIDHNLYAIYHWQSGKSIYMPSVENLIKLADYFKCSVDYLIGLEDDYHKHCQKEPLSFAEWFRPAIEAKGYNLYRLGKETRIGTQQFYKWIQGKSYPKIDSLIKISKILDCTLDYLIGREN